MSYKLYKRKGSPVWQVVVTRVGEKSVRRSTKTTIKKDAEQFGKELEAVIWRQSQLGEVIYTWEQAVIKWLDESKHKKSLETDIHRLRVLDEYLSGIVLEDISRELIESTLSQLEQKRGLSKASQNRYLSIITTILRKASNDWEWIERAPKMRKRDEPKKRVRWIKEHEAKALIRTIPEQHRGPVELGFMIGLRKSNLYDLKWSQVDLKRRCAWIYSDEAKGKKDLAVALNDSALAVIKRQMGLNEVYVFGGINPPRPENWNRWVEKAGIKERFRFHDIRHTWASWHVMAGTSLHTLMELGGWSSYEMVLKYAHLSPDHLNEAAQNIDTKLNTVDFGLVSISSGKTPK